MSTVKTLIVDDSFVYRSQIRTALRSISQIEIVGAVSNGWLAIDWLLLFPVDLLILDMEMPELDGLQTMREIEKRGIECKILVFSSTSKKGAEVTMEALRLGASDFIAKPGKEDSFTQEPGNPSERIKSLLEPRIQSLFPQMVDVRPPEPQPLHQSKYVKVIWDLLNPKIVVIGASTGGPTLLEKIFSELSPPLNCPIVIVQHMPPLFTATLAERLESLSGISACEAKNGDVLEKNRIYIAPGGYHLQLHGTPQRTTLTLDVGPQINSVRPAADPTFSSAARIFKNDCLGFVLTGMGADGKNGAEEIKKNGGAVVIQNESSCVVFGMPRAVLNAGAYDRIANPAEIIEILHDKVAPTLI